MAESTKIEWADATMNPWVGCTKVSAACDSCYAESWAKRTGQPGLWAGDRRRTTPAYWRQPLKWNAESPAKHGRPTRVFCASLSDIFDNQVPTEWRNDLWELIGSTPDLIWMLLTKRPQNIAKMLPVGMNPYTSGWPWPNVWLGTTAENQTEADRRIPLLLAAPAAKHFISCEPLLSSIDLSPWVDKISWTIVGGESGPKARPMHPDWARSLRDQCKAAGVPFHFKQHGEYREALPGDLEAGKYYEAFSFTGDVRQQTVIKFGKKRAGRLLDGVEHDAFPA